MEDGAKLAEPGPADAAPSGQARLPRFCPTLSAQRQSCLVAPAIFGSNIHSLNISIASPIAGQRPGGAEEEEEEEEEEDRAHLRSSGPTFSSVEASNLHKQPSATVQQRLKSSFRRRFGHLAAVMTEARKTPLHDIYTELFLTEGGSGEVNREHEVRQIEVPAAQERSFPCSQLFQPAEGRQDRPRSVITRGVAGIGKTVSVNKFALDWAEGRDNAGLDLVFPLSFRDLNLMREKTLSFERLLAEFFPETRGSGVFRGGGGRMLFILDGLDESRLRLDFHDAHLVTEVRQEAPVGVLLVNLIRGRLPPRALVWVTSRPVASGQIPRRHLDLTTEIRGFSDAQKDEYFRRKIGERELAERVIAHVKACRSLHIMCHIPMFCLMAANVLQRKLSAAADGRDTPRSLTQMYIQFLRLLEDHIKERHPGRPEAGAALLKEHLKALGGLAFRQLERGHLIFYREDLRQSGIEAAQACALSALYTEVFSQEAVLCREKLFCFVHLSLQEFFAALHVFLKFNNDNLNVLSGRSSLGRWFLPRGRSERLLYRAAVEKALRSPEGHYDLFLRFLLGLSLESNRRLLEPLMLGSRSRPKTRADIVKHLKEKIRSSRSPDRCVNLFHCLNELNDGSLVEEIQGYVRSRHQRREELSASQWNALVVVLLASQEDLRHFQLSHYARSEEGLLRLLPVVRAAREARLDGCRLTAGCCERLSAAIGASRLRRLDLSHNDLRDAGMRALGRGLREAKLDTLRLRSCNLTGDSAPPVAAAIGSASCTLRLLDLSDNELGDAGVQRLCGALRSPDCRLETLLLSLCGLTAHSCRFLASALASGVLRELDLSYNHPGASGLELLAALLRDPRCSLQSLRAEDCGESWIRPAPLKYSAQLSLDPNTAHRDLFLSEGNLAARRWTRQKYPDHPERFEFWVQVMSAEGLTGRRYWEAEWSGRAFVGAAYRSLGRKGAGDDSCLGENRASWGLNCTPEGVRAWPDGPGAASTGSGRVGVFLDWSAGTLAFYTVAGGAPSLLHTFRTTFSEPVHAAFGLRWTDSSVRLC